MHVSGPRAGIIYRITVGVQAEVAYDNVLGYYDICTLGVHAHVSFMRSHSGSRYLFYVS